MIDAMMTYLRKETLVIMTKTKPEGIDLTDWMDMLIREGLKNKLKTELPPDRREMVKEAARQALYARGTDLEDGDYVSAD